MNSLVQEDVLDKIWRGLDLSEERLLIAKAKNDEELVLDRDGKIVYVKARDLLRERNLSSAVH